MPSQRFDLIVVGAGPAGCAAAITAAQVGQKVALIERATFPRPAPGESLHPGVEPLLARLGVSQAVLAAGFLRFSGHQVRWGQRRGFEPFGRDAAGPWLGFQAWRPTFDALLLARARELDVAVVQPCPGVQPVVAGEHLVGVDTPLGSFRAPITVDATGRRRAVARQVGASLSYRGPKRIVHYGYAAGNCPALNSAPRIVADAQGWTWSARVRPQLYHWCRLTTHGRPARDDPRPSDLQGLRAVGRPRAADMTWRMAALAPPDNLFVVGDAAAVLDPISSHGVLRALMSGMMAAHLIDDICRGQVSQRAANLQYVRWLGDWFWRDVRRLEAMYGELSGPDMLDAPLLQQAASSETSDLPR